MKKDNNKCELDTEVIEKSKEKKENFFKKISKLFSKIPKTIKIIFLILIITIILTIGLVIPSKMNHKEIILEFGFKDVGKLVTQEWYGRVIEDSSKSRKIFNKFSIPFTESRIIFSIDVEVIAGLDFAKIDWKLKDENTIKIKIPRTEIYKYYQVPNTFKSYLDDESWFTNIGSKERHGLEDAVVENGKQNAIDSGILDKADKNAKVIIEQMVKSKNKDLKIEWEYKE